MSLPLRPAVDVRPVEAADLEALVALHHAVVSETTRSAIAWVQHGPTDLPTTEQAAEVLAFNAQRPGRHVLVAVVHEEVVAVAAADVATASLISGPKVLVLTDLQVHPDHRKKAVASTLLKAMAAVAEREDCFYVVAAMPTWAKESNRFLTKWGFGQVATVRGVPLSRLHARLATKASGSKETGRLVAVRRSLRRRDDATD